MKDRIKLVMESLHMGQQTFAQYIEMSPASLSSIFNGRTKPTINIVEAIKTKIPNISTEWLVFGQGSMYLDSQEAEVIPSSSSNVDSVEPMPGLFDSSASPLNGQQITKGVDRMPKSGNYDLFSEVSKIDKRERKITEIRVFFDDNTWESFSPFK